MNTKLTAAAVMLFSLLASSNAFAMAKRPPTKFVFNQMQAKTVSDIKCSDGASTHQTATIDYHDANGKGLITDVSNQRSILTMQWTVGSLQPGPDGGISFTSARVMGTLARSGNKLQGPVQLVMRGIYDDGFGNKSTMNGESTGRILIDLNSKLANLTYDSSFSENGCTTNAHTDQEIILVVR